MPHERCQAILWSHYSFEKRIPSCRFKAGHAGEHKFRHKKHDHYRSDARAYSWRREGIGFNPATDNLFPHERAQSDLASPKDGAWPKEADFSDLISDCHYYEDADSLEGWDEGAKRYGPAARRVLAALKAGGVAT